MVTKLRQPGNMPTLTGRYPGTKGTGAFELVLERFETSKLSDI
jgi:hypothetical protein